MEFNYLHFSPFLDLTVDRLDDAYVPKKGVYTKLRGEFVFLAGQPEFFKVLEKSFLSFRFQWKNVWPLSKRITAISDLHFGANLFNQPSPTYYHMLGGAGDYFFNNQQQFLGYRYQELFIRQFVATGALHLLYQLIIQVYSDLAVNIASFNTDWDDYTMFKHLGGTGVKLIWMTPFGPVSGTVHGSFEDFDLYGFISVGFNF